MNAAWIALLSAIASSMAGQILLKLGTEGGAGSFAQQVFRPATLAGLVFYGAGAFLYIYALRRIPMSVALPCTAASYALIALIGWWFFGESMGAQKLAAIFLIMAGVALLATA